MKKLFKNSIIALVLLSFFAASCEKEKVNAVPIVNETTTTWKPTWSAKPIVTKGEIKFGQVGVLYTIVPTFDPAKCCGLWELKTEAPKNVNVFAGIMPKTGIVTFTPTAPGTYKFTITSKCPDGSTTSISVSITVDY